MGKNPFVTYLGDNPLRNGIGVTPNMMIYEKVKCVKSFMPVTESQRYCIAELSEDGKKVLRCIEKPNSNPAMIRVNAFNHKFFEMYPMLAPS